MLRVRNAFSQFPAPYHNNPPSHHTTIGPQLKFNKNQQISAIPTQSRSTPQHSNHQKSQKYSKNQSSQHTNLTSANASPKTSTTATTATTPAINKNQINFLFSAKTTIAITHPTSSNNTKIKSRQNEISTSKTHLYRQSNSQSQATSQQ